MNFYTLMKFDLCSDHFRCKRPIPFNCIFLVRLFWYLSQCTGLARSVLFFVTVYIVKISTVYNGLTILFLGIKLFYFSRWKAKICLKKDFNSIRHRIEKMEIKIVWMSWMSWNFERFHKIHFQTDAESFSFLPSKTKKTYS